MGGGGGGVVLTGGAPPTSMGKRAEWRHGDMGMASSGRSCRHRDDLVGPIGRPVISRPSGGCAASSECAWREEGGDGGADGRKDEGANTEVRSD